jgi:hypothetical protein
VNAAPRLSWTQISNAASDTLTRTWTEDGQPMSSVISNTGLLYFHDIDFSVAPLPPGTPKQVQSVKYFVKAVNVSVVT